MTQSRTAKNLQCLTKDADYRVLLVPEGASEEAFEAPPHTDKRSMLADRP